jgi:dTDP-glucose 4,6-dehydratase
MNILVAGAGGFLGSHLCDHLLAGGHSVVGLDNFVTGRPANIAHLAGNRDFRLLTADVSEPIEWPSGLARPDAIAHLASPASPVDFAPLAIPIMRANGEGSYRLLELARETGARFLLASTSEVYGDPAVHPQREDYVGHVNPIGVRSVYDESKRYAEAMTAAYRRRFGVDTKIARIFNTYGPRMRADDGRVLPAFISAATKNEPIPVQGDGRQTRSFCYVSDLVEGLARLLFSDQTGPVNIGNPGEVSMLQLAEEVIAAMHSRSTIQFAPLPPDDPKRRCPDISLAKKLLNWSPTVERSEGLRRTVEYFREVVAKI